MILSEFLLQILPGSLRAVARAAIARIHSESRRTSSDEAADQVSFSPTAISGSYFISNPLCRNPLPGSI